jgi:2-polyprenyl-3-methyl-5-hydroxy-6-metoxy-1,4-benzoquinol methylase
MQPGSEKSTSIPGNLTKPEVFNACGPFQRVLPGTKFSDIFNSLKNGEHLCFEGTFGFALTFYSWLKKQNNLRIPVKDYQSSRKNLDQFRSLISNLMVRIHNHKAALEKAPEVPWLKDFYPEKKEFLIRFSDFLGMNGAWQWFIKGIKFPVLDQRVHPFYGVYFPTRHEHLTLFDVWLAKNTGFSKALDIGTGCGVLALMMLKYGIPFVHATDVNPNAVHSAALEFEKRGLQSKTLIEQAPFTGSYETGGGDLILFNPPWIPVQTNTELDRATYYGPGFFEKFFSTVRTKMKKETTLVLLFSDFAQAAGITGHHPIENEIQNKTRFLLIEKLEASIAQKPSARKNWLTEIRKREKVELWVLKSG